MTSPVIESGVPANLFLIGYRATGKSTVGALLAPKLGWNFVDADALLEARAGMSVREIFLAEGEAGFRRRESALLEQLCQGSRQVVATGGGIVLAPANRQLLLSSGRCALLEADAATIECRLSADPITAGRRPNLTVGGRDEIEAMLALRQPLYEQCAGARFSVVRQTPEQVARAILDWLQKPG